MKSIFNLARFLAGATDADVELIKATWPDCPIRGPESRAEVLAWLETRHDLATAVLKTDPSQPPDPYSKTLWTAAELLSVQFPEPRWLIPGLIPEGLVALAGRPKVGKSWLALQIAWAVGCGGRIFDRIATQARVLYLALEDSPRRLQRRLKTQRWQGEIWVDFVTDWPDLAGNGGLAALQKKIAEGKYGLVIVDTLSRAARYDQAKIDEATVVWGNLQRMANDLQITLMVIDHHRKPAVTVQDVVDDLLGSTGKGATADAILGLYRERGKQAATLHLTGRDIEEHNLALSWEPVTCTWHLLGEAADVALRESQLKVLKALEELGGRATASEIAEYLGDNKGSVSRALNSLCAVGRLGRSREGHKVYFSVNDVGKDVSQ